MQAKILTHEQRRLRRGEMQAAVIAGESPSDVASRFGVTQATVYLARQFGSMAPGKAQGAHPNSVVTPEQWAAVDWNMQDRDIAPILGVTRSRVQQVRQYLKKPKAVTHRQGKKTMGVRGWLAANKEDLEGLSLAQISTLMPFKTGFQTIERVCAELNINLTKPLRIDEMLNRGNLSQFVDVDSETSCWNWILSPTAPTYPKVGNAGPLHHVIYKMFHGEVPDGLWVLHKCDNPRCANPAHIYAGTAKENAADRQRNGNTRSNVLDSATVRRMRDKFAAGGVTLRELAGEFEISYTTAWHVISGRTHKSSFSNAVIPA